MSFAVPSLKGLEFKVVFEWGIYCTASKLIRRFLF